MYAEPLLTPYRRIACGSSQLHSATSYCLGKSGKNTCMYIYKPKRKKGISEMSTTNDPTQGDNVYFIDHESAAEMARLLTQDQMLTNGMAGLFPEQFDP